MVSGDVAPDLSALVLRRFARSFRFHCGVCSDLRSLRETIRRSITARFLKLLCPRLTSVRHASMAAWISPGKSTFLRPIPAGSTYRAVSPCGGWTLVCCGTSSFPISLLSGSCSSVPVFAVSLPSAYGLPQAAL